MEYDDIVWKETGLAALFGPWPSSGQQEDIIDVSDNYCESGSAKCWRFAPSAFRIVPAHCIEKVVDWV